MTEHPTLPPRPVASGSIAGAIGGWLQWFGLARLVGGAISVLIVCAGVLLLVQSPTPATEAALPVATGGVVVSTLPPPTSPVALGPPTSSTPPTSPIALPVVVHVAGAVVASGVYQLPAPARVADAVAAAGGVAADGDLDAVNLAAAVVDGQRVYVPRLGEVDPASVPSGGNVAATGAGPGSTAAPGPVDLNTATAEQFEQLPGVGPATAAAIVNDRDLHGPFASVDDLDRVPGIGTAKLEALRQLVTV